MSPTSTATSQPHAQIAQTISSEAMTADEIRRRGRDLSMEYGFGPSPFGEAIVALTPRGVCHLAFCMREPDAMVAELANGWAYATLVRNDEGACALLSDIFAETSSRARVPLLLRGTPFQLKVWAALMQTEFGHVLSYGQLAQTIGAPRAHRAVGSAVAANQIAYLIPCHRVIRASGDVGQFRWGATRKRAIQIWEAGQAERLRVIDAA